MIAPYHLSHSPAGQVAGHEAAGLPVKGLPTDLTSSPFVGHETLLASLAHAVRTGNERLITLAGPGGIGKSRLAQELVRTLAADFDGRVAWISLAHLHDAGQVVAAFAEIFNLDQEFGPNPLLVQAVAWLGDRPALLVLDNAEHLPDLPPGLACVLRNCPRVSFIITSRLPLGMEMEHVVPVPALPVPDLLDDGSEHARLYSSPAARLFEERARRAAPGFRLTPANIESVARVCSLLGGMPLAIELAASRTALYSPADLLAFDQHLVTAIDSPASGGGNASPLQSTIAWSMERLSPPAREAATWLSLLPGGFTLETARLMCDASPATVAELLDHHLVQASDDEAGHRRFRMHELIRQAATGLLDQAGRREASARLLAAMREVSNAFLALPHDGYFNAHLTALVAEAPNLRHALVMALDEGDFDTAVVLLLTLEHYWSRRSRFDEMTYWIERFRALGSDDMRDAHAEAWATFLRFSAAMLSLQGQHAQALPAAIEAVRLARASGSDYLLARCLLAQSWTSVQLREFEATDRILAEVAPLAERLGHAKTSVDLAMQSGVAALFDERLDEAEARLVVALDRARASGEPGEIARILHFLGYAMQFAGHYQRGRDFLDEAIALAEPDTHRVAAVAAIARGRLELRAGRPDAAAPWISKVLRLRLGLGDTTLLRIPLIDAAIVLHCMGQPELAVQALGAAGADDERAKPRTLFNSPGQGTYDALRARMGPEKFRRIYARGARRPHHELMAAILDALECLSPGSSADPFRELSQRERQVLALMAQGSSNPAIARALSIGAETVKSHTRSIMRKLGVTSRSAAVALAVREGLVTSPIQRAGTGTARSAHDLA